MGEGEGFKFGFGEAHDGAAFYDAYGYDAGVFAFFDVGYGVADFYSSGYGAYMKGLEVFVDHVGIGAAVVFYGFRGIPGHQRCSPGRQLWVRRWTS